MTEHRRWYEIDLIKAVSIMTVVLIHSINSGFGHQSGLEKVLGDWSRFAVPFFLFAAGFLFRKSGSSTSALARKLALRIIPPYLICSLFMLGFRATWLEPRLGSPTWLQIIAMFVFGETGSIYYFVFVISYLYALSLWWRTWPNRWLFILWGTEIVLTIIFYARQSWFFPDRPDLFWPILFRHPVIHLLPYLTGWLVSIHYARMRPWLSCHSFGLMAMALTADITLVAILQKVPEGPMAQWFVQIHIYLWLMGLICIGIRYSPRSKIIRLLSETSYAIYLIHFPIVRAVQYTRTDSWQQYMAIRILLTWIIGSVSSVLVIIALRRLLGSRSRIIIGG